MENPRPEKVAVVEEVRAKLEAADAVLITEYRGLRVGELAALRSAMRAGGGEYKVYKNTLVRIAARELGLDIEDVLTGPTALAFVSTQADGTPGDVATVAKAIQDFAKGQPLLVMKGGVLGDSVLDAGAAKALASLPTGPEIYSRLAGAINSQARSLASVVAGVHRSIAYVLQAAIEADAFDGDAPQAEEASVEAPNSTEADDSESAAPEAPASETDASASEPGTDAEAASEESESE
jgi:large subunit ribosomal protein L10